MPPNFSIWLQLSVPSNRDLSCRQLDAYPPPPRPDRSSLKNDHDKNIAASRVYPGRLRIIATLILSIATVYTLCVSILLYYHRVYSSTSPFNIHDTSHIFIRTAYRVCYALGTRHLQGTRQEPRFQQPTETPKP